MADRLPHLFREETRMRRAMLCSIGFCVFATGPAYAAEVGLAPVPLPVLERAQSLTRPLSLSLAGLAALDAGITLAAMSTGAREANPMMSPVVGHPVAFVALKATSVASSILLASKLRERHPKGAVVAMIAA